MSSAQKKTQKIQLNFTFETKKPLLQNNIR